jgi:hypothetical protein
VRRRSGSLASVLGGGILALRRWSSRTCRRTMVSTRLSELFRRRDEKSPATPIHAASHGGRTAAPMEDGGATTPEKKMAARSLWSSPRFRAALPGRSVAARRTRPC